MKLTFNEMWSDLMNLEAAKEKTHVSVTTATMATSTILANSAYSIVSTVDIYLMVGAAQSVDDTKLTTKGTLLPSNSYAIITTDTGQNTLFFKAIDSNGKIILNRTRNVK